jgi:hypothetical protein
MRKNQLSLWQPLSLTDGLESERVPEAKIIIPPNQVSLPETLSM